MIQIFPGQAAWCVSYPYCAEPSCRKAKKSCGQFSRISASKLKNGCFWHVLWFLNDPKIFPENPAVSPFPVYAPLTSDQVWEISCAGLTGKSVHGRTHTRDSQVLAQLQRAQGPGLNFSGCCCSCCCLQEQLNQTSYSLNQLLMLPKLLEVLLLMPLFLLSPSSDLLQQ